ncbi:unnamed protein product [Clonostachys rhizophaga]|uniref:Uncharacterized protein n=1 Tax=Clonostachys rhizophaga TaxID=160324 RepID=A0A9N9YX81_9HYPO|nr:unnamed protein product [Clonostachys rhizophaga]
MFHADSTMAELLLENGADIEAHDYEHITPLQQAVINGFVEPARLLLSMGADVNAAYTFEKPGSHRRQNSPAIRTPFMLACGLVENREICLEMVKLLLDHGASVHINDKDKGLAGMPVLHYAASSHFPDILDAVIDAGADIMATDNYGRTSFHHWVLGYRQHGVLCDLRYEGAYSTPPSAAASCLRILVSKGGCEHMNKTAKWKHEFQIKLQHETEPRYSTFISQERTYSPLALALIENDKELFDELHRLGAEFETDAPLVVCLSKAVEMMSPDAIEYLLANGATFPVPCINEFADLDKILLYGWSSDRRTLLWWAVLNSSVGAVEVLTRLGADPFNGDVEQLDCFLIAFVEEKFENLRFLLEFSEAHPRADHWTQHLDHSKLAGDWEMLVEVCQALKKKGTLRDVGKSLLSRASKSGHALVIGALLQVGVDTEAGDRAMAIDAANYSDEALNKGLPDFGVDALSRRPLLDLGSDHVVS